MNPYPTSSHPRAGHATSVACLVLLVVLAIGGSALIASGYGQLLRTARSTSAFAPACDELSPGDWRTPPGAYRQQPESRLEHPRATS